ncbi:MAG TPA: glycoside hydrolase family 3 N-terminal domain-containing protein [Gammaproteobacteria bacterium]
MLPLLFGLLYISFTWRTPQFSAYRWLVGSLFVLVTLLLLSAASLLLRNTVAKPDGFRRLIKAGAALSLAALLIFLGREFQFQWMRYTVLNVAPETLSRFGRHIVVGFRSPAFAEELIARKGVAGIFITAHNVEGEDAATIRAMLEKFQTLQRTKGGQALWIATDQEGGRVSRMTPPLAAQPSLGEVVGQHASDGSLEAAIRNYGQTQGTALAALGINLNFAPVVDINYHIVNQADRYTRIYQRAISSDPRMVEHVAGWYCEALYASGVRCTLKHFPGLGRVATDTHLDSAKLTVAPTELAQSDWLPFKALMQGGQPPFTMLSHVQLAALDATEPVSTSKPVVDNLLRKQWGYDGVLITDDFSMAAISQRQGGIGAATINALNAGVDLILISFDPEQYYPAMYSLLQAERDGTIDEAMLERSNKRLSDIVIP